MTAIYLNPIFTASSNHKYDTADYMHVDPGFGGDEAFAALAQAARANGIRLILDGVFNHTGMDSIYFNRNGNYGSGGAYQDAQSPYRRWYRLENQQYDCWWGVSDLPNVNERNESYQDFIYRNPDSVIRHWLRAGASGWRLDVADELPDGFIAAIRTAMRETDPDALLMGEVWEDASHKESYGQRRRYLLGSELDCTMHYPFRTAVTDFMLGKLDAERLCAQMRSLQENYPPTAFRAALNLIGSHDRARVLTLMGDTPDGQPLSPAQHALAVRRVQLLSLLQFTAPGVPCIYYGDEAGVEGGEDPDNRGPFPWGHEDPTLMPHYRNLTQLRQAHPVLTKGGFEPLFFGGDVYGCLRTGETESILALANRSADAPHQVHYRCDAGFALDLLTGRVLPVSDGWIRLELAPLEGVCLCLKPTPPVQTPMGRKAGILCPVASLPGPHATGTMGADARAFLRYLKDAGQTIWQILPLNPVGLGNSPYSSPAVFAGDPRLIDPDEPVDEARYPDWLAANAGWVEDYALFMALHDAYQAPWQQWPAAARRRENLPALRRAHAAAVGALPSRTVRLLAAVGRAARLRQVAGNGDCRRRAHLRQRGQRRPLGRIRSNSCWMQTATPRSARAAPRITSQRTDRTGKTRSTTGTPWPRTATSGGRRGCSTAPRIWTRYEVDHFRAFSAYFAIPTGMHPKDGQWLKGPGLPFWEQMRATLGELHILAEDLGDLDAGVYSLLAETGLPGMSVWQFHAAQMRSMDSAVAAHRAFYTGTHDNQKRFGWLAGPHAARDGYPRRSPRNH